MPSSTLLLITESLEITTTTAITGSIFWHLTRSVSGCDLELDISLAHPWNGDVLFQAAREDDTAALKREHSKAKYTVPSLMRGGTKQTVFH